MYFSKSRGEVFQIQRARCWGRQNGQVTSPPLSSGQVGKKLWQKQENIGVEEINLPLFKTKAQQCDSMWLQSFLTGVLHFCKENYYTYWWILTKWTSLLWYYHENPDNHYYMREAGWSSVLDTSQTLPVSLLFIILPSTSSRREFVKEINRHESTSFGLGNLLIGLEAFSIHPKYIVFTKIVQFWLFSKL